jgi:EmrB/QacA subfamily drug resistance transporter
MPAHRTQSWSSVRTSGPLRRLRRAVRGGQDADAPAGDLRLLIILMIPTVTMILNVSTFGVALPTIRAEFGIDADVAAWLVTAYTLPFMMLMPLYGRLGDGLGKRNLIIFGLFVFAVGTMITLAAPNLAWLLAGRTVQGAGVAGIAPLSMAIIAERFDPSQRGQAMGTWNSVGPLVGIFGPLTAGFMIDYWGWRSIFVPALGVALFAIVVVYIGIPSLRTVKLSYLQSFDWLGVILLGGGITFFVFYVSSRVITGVEPLRDWRLLAASLLFLAGFVLRERQRRDPFLDLALFRNSSLRLASMASGLRMFTMNGIGFLMPLYLADVRGLSASAIGSMVMLNAIALLTTMRLGGRLADRAGSRLLVAGGMSTQAATMVYFGLLPAQAPLYWIAVGLAVHGLGAGLSLAALHRAALSHVAVEDAGAAAGVYSMIRFSGTLMGAALGGVLLQQALETQATTVAAYQQVFFVIAFAAAIGALIGLALREQ